MKTVAPKAHKVWLVQIFEVAFSRRICCSRVAKVKTNPRRPSLSTVSPTSLPGRLRTNFFWQAKKPKAGPPRLIGTPRLCPSPTAISAPKSPGRLEQPERDRLGGDGDQLRSCFRARGLDRREIFDGAKKVGITDHDAHRLRVKLRVKMIPDPSFRWRRRELPPSARRRDS